VTRWWPFPLLSAGLFVMWLLLNQSLAPGQVLLGAVVALAGGWALAPLRPPRARLRRPWAMIRLAGLVLADIVRSNIAVASIILGPGKRRERSGFVDIPLELRDPYALATLACIITATPGTLWVSFDSASGVVMIHVLDLVDESDWVRIVKHRYERLLREIFE
jgi:multicomponent K+:H+ antiporter subunit E